MDKIQKAFKALGEPTRMKIVKILSRGSMCVCELSEFLNISQPRVSQHLRILKDEGLVRESRESYWVYYSLDKEVLHRLWYDFLVFLDADLQKLKDFTEVVKRMENAQCNERIKDTKEKLKKGY